MIDHSLDDSDVKFLEEGTDAVSSLMPVCHYQSEIKIVFLFHAEQIVEV